MFLEVSISRQTCAYAIDAILRIDKEVDGKACLILKSNPEFRILTDSIYESLMINLKHR
jgi:hypothetical protein